MLDTDISSYIIKRRPAPLLERFMRHAEELCVSVMTAAELRLGAEKARRPTLNEEVDQFLERLSILDWTESVTAHYARTRCALEAAGTPIGNMDLLIASHALSERAILVTHNVRHFAKVAGLKIEEWA